MAKGNRKRSNKNNIESPKKVEKLYKDEKVEKKQTVYEMFPARTLNQDDANKMKEIFVLSNNIAALIKDYADKDIAVASMRVLAKEIEKDKEPLMLKVSSNLYKSKRDYKQVAKQIRTQADAMEKGLTISRGQIEHRYEDYVSSLIIHKRMIEEIIQSAKLKSITGNFADEKTKAEEEVLFEKDFDKMTDADKAQLAELDKVIKKAAKKEAEKREIEITPQEQMPKNSSASFIKKHRKEIKE